MSDTHKNLQYGNNYKAGIFAEHIFYADSSVCNHLSSLFNVCSMHSKIPQECMQTVIVPICKNKNGNISDAGNHRPVSLATIISKLFEHYILSCTFGHNRQPVWLQVKTWH